MEVFILLANIILNSPVCKDNGNFTNKNYVDLIDFNDDLMNYIFSPSHLYTYISTCSTQNSYIRIQKNEFFLEIIKYTHNNKLLLEKHIITIIILSYNQKLCKNTGEIIQYLFDIGCKFTDNIIYAIFASRNYNAINIILNQKIDVAEKHFKSIFESINSYREIIIPDVLNCIKLIINFGYVLSKDDLLLMLKNNMNPEEKMINNDYCKDADFYSQAQIKKKKKNMFPNNFNIKPNVFALVELVKKSAKIAEIKKFIKDNKIVPTIECLREACKHKAYSAVIKYFTETHGLKPDIECMQNVVELTGYSQLSYIFEKFKN
jgi:hypothetical protein